MSHQLADLITVVGMEWITIIVVVVLLFFGVKKVPQLARSFGKASAEI